MTILIVSRGVPSESSPLNGIFEFDQANALRNKGHKIIYVALDFRSLRRKRPLGYKKYTINGINIYSMSLPLGPIYHKGFNLIGRKALLWLYKIIIRSEGHPDLIHSHFTVYSGIASIIKEKYDIPLVVTEHSSLLNKEKIDSLTKYWASRAYSHADVVISVSTILSKRLLSHYSIKSPVIPNIVDSSSFFFENQRHEGFVFISVGNLIPSKGFELLIDAFSGLDESDTKLIIVGDGPLYEKLQNKINDLGISNRVTLTGRKHRKDINKLMNASDAFVLATRSETFGVVFIEAMMTGLPVIATRCGGPEDFVNPDNGVLIPVNDMMAVREAMNFMVQNRHRFNGSVISKFSSNEFSPERVSSRLTNIYNTVIEKK